MNVIGKGLVAMVVAAAWITWEVQVRNRSMARLLRADLFECLTDRPRFMRYCILGWQTFSVFSSRKYTLIFVQNPSIVLSLLGVMLGALFGITVVVDAHNGGLFPVEGRSRILGLLAKFVARRADLNIVSNRYLEKTVQQWGGRAFVMRDPLPDIGVEYAGLKAVNWSRRAFDVLFVCTWARDEPFHEVLTAAAQNPEVTFVVTGNYKKALSAQMVAQLPGNVILTGYVSETCYRRLLYASKVVMDLTRRDHCLVCGAYEAIAVQRPCIVSDTAVNRDSFSDGFVFTKNTSVAITSAVKQSLKQREQLMQGVLHVKMQFVREQAIVVERLRQRLFELRWENNASAWRAGI